MKLYRIFRDEVGATQCTVTPMVYKPTRQRWEVDSNAEYDLPHIRHTDELWEFGVVSPGALDLGLSILTDLFGVVPVWTHEIVVFTAKHLGHSSRAGSVVLHSKALTEWLAQYRSDVALRQAQAANSR